MHSKLSIAVLALVVISCASGVAPPDAPAATAHVELISLSPLAGSAIDEDTELVAEINYRIDGFKPGVDYYLAPLFASAKGSGTTFNMLDRISDASKVSSAEGRITVRYAIRRELGSAQLARPVTVWFYLMERIGSGQTRVVGKTDAVAFKTTAA